MRLQLKRSNVLASGSAKTPTASQLEYGELAINYNTDDPAIFLKDSNNNVIRISGVGNIADDGQVELPATTTPPSNPQSGNLWYNSDDGRLYIYYTDADSSQWVDASPDSWDPTVLPDTTNSSSQSGTLDDRYLMLNSGNDPITGGLNITGGNVGIGTTSPNNLLDVRGDSDPQIKVSAANTGMLPTSAGLYIENQGQRNWQIWADRSSDQLRIGHNSRASTVVSVTDSRVGIGVTTPTSPLHVSGDIKTEGAFLALPFSGSSEGGEIQLKNPDATTNGAIIDISSANTFRIFQLNNNSTMQLGQLSGTGGTITMHTSGQERFRVDSVGNCGIGTSAPITDLTVRGIASGTEGANLCIQNTGSGLNTSVALYLTPNDGGGNDLQRTAAIKSRQDQAGNFADLEFYTAASNTPTERLRITSLGRIGVGTSNPGYIFDVEGGPSSAQFSSTANWNFSNVYIRRKASNIGIAKMISMMLDGDSASSTNLTSSLNIWGTFSGTPTTSSTSSALNAAMNLGAPEAILFHTNGSERARILPNGRVCINRSLSQSGGQLSIDYTNGITAGLAIKDTKTTGTGVILHVVNGSGGIVGGISQNQSSTSFNTSSDYRLKENIVDLDGAIDRVKQLLPKRFNFINDADTTVDGFLAHEAQVVVPEAVTGTQDETEIIGTLTEWDGTVLETNVTEPTTEELTWEETTINEDGEESTVTRTRTWTPTGNQPVYQGIDQAKLVPLLTAALQEAITRIEALENA